MRKFFVIGLAALSLAGCASFDAEVMKIKQAASVIGEATVSSEAIYIAANSFDAVEVTATNYLNLKRCPIQAPFCRDPRATQPITSAIRSGRVSRNNAVQFLKSHPDEKIGPKGLYDAVIAGTDTINQILAQYKAVR